MSHRLVDTVNHQFISLLRFIKGTPAFGYENFTSKNYGITGKCL